MFKFYFASIMSVRSTPLWKREGSGSGRPKNIRIRLGSGSPSLLGTKQSIYFLLSGCDAWAAEDSGAARGNNLWRGILAGWDGARHRLTWRQGQVLPGRTWERIFRPARWLAIFESVDTLPKLSERPLSWTKYLKIHQTLHVVFAGV